MSLRFWSVGLFVLILSVVKDPSACASPNDDIASEVYRILSRTCFECHGPKKQDGGLRLDSIQQLKLGGDTGPAIDTMEFSKSELLRRIRLPVNDSERMPKRGDSVPPGEIKKIESWIEHGLPWPSESSVAKHWSYLPPSRSSIPDEGSIRSPIDYWVSKKWKEHGIASSPLADLYVLARRIYFDTIGIPPNPSQADEFVAAAKQDVQKAVDQLVDELLQSQHYGEKWATPWLDAARYADSHGFQRDDLHDLWAYRDWVIRSLNEDMPFDKFTIEQIAGDLLPDATESQIIATGFNRCAPCNVEAGTDPQENRFNQIVDRVNTLGYVWLGSSLECAQCHDHKYDPFTQRDYYGLFAFFNQTEIEAERSNPKVPGSIRFIGPYMELGSLTEQAEIASLEKRISEEKSRLDHWTASKDAEDFSPSHSQTTTMRLVAFESSDGSTHEFLNDGSVLIQGDPADRDTYAITFETKSQAVTGFLLEAMKHPSLPGSGPGRGDAAKPNFVLQDFKVFHIRDAGTESIPLKLIEAKASFSQKNYDVNGAIDSNQTTGWAIAPQFSKPHWAAFRLESPVAFQEGDRIQIEMIQNFGSARTIGNFRISAIEGDFIQSLPTPKKESKEIVELRKTISELQKQRDAISLPKTLVMREQKVQRTTTMFARGDFRSPSAVVEPSTPAVLHPFSQIERKDRLGLARWLVSPNNPLVGRVIVNRIWSEIFGIGLVATPEDFGLKGTFPSHPELLDWLACDFVEEGWSQKRLLRKILTSETYRQSSRASPSILERDPTNQFLARGPRFRLNAEFIRDTALSIANQLSLKQFGPPIRPPQPDGLWRKVGGQQYDYQVSPGDESKRRGVYVVLKRMSPYPSFINFDSTSRLACRVKRNRSNTPLQALNLLNDPVYVEAARGLVRRVLQSSPDGTLDERIQLAFRYALVRPPSIEEIEILRKLYLSEWNPGQNASVVDDEHAWFAVASALMNLDETITKE